MRLARWYEALLGLGFFLCVGCEGGLESQDVSGWVSPGPAQASSLNSGARVRLMAANLTSGRGQSYDSGNGGRLMQGVAPDIVMIQEFNYGSNSAADLRDFTDTFFSPEHEFVREERSAIPNGVISRFPIVASGTWRDSTVPNREHFWARIDVPGDRDLWAVSVHLSAGGANNRRQAASELARRLGESIPEGDYLAVGGDFNTGSRSEGAIRALSERLVTSGPFPNDNRGNGNTSASRSKPLDWILFNEALQNMTAPVTIGSNSFPSGLVLDSRIYSPLDEIYPTRRDDSASPSMQHMGVVRDVVL